MPHHADILVLLINLDSSPERLAQAGTALRGAGLAFERVAAVDGRRFSEAQRSQYGADWRGRYFQPLQPGEIGCYLSHIQALQRFLDTDHTHALIVEDDARVDPGVRACIDALVAMGGELPAAVSLFGSRRTGRELRVLSSGHRLMRSTSTPWGTMAILWTRAGASAMLKAAGSLHRPIDIDRKHWWERCCAPVWVSPAPFFEPPVGEAPTTITGRASSSLGARVRKMAYRWRFSVQSHLEYVKAFGPVEWLRAQRPVRRMAQP